MGLPNFANRTLYQGDNLPFLQGINSETVDLIATDPPFKKGRDFHATPDSLAAGARFTDRWRWDNDVQPEWMDAIKDDWPKAESVISAAWLTSGADMAAFLCWLGVRLMECRRILKPTGSMYLHIDFTAHAWAKCLMDGIFGRDNFHNEIAWCYRSTSQAKRWFPRKHDAILFYSKGSRWIFNPDAAALREEYILERLPRRINDPARNRGGSGNWPGATEEELTERYAQGKLAPDWWEITFGPNSPERTGYPTQKPLSLYERIIAASSNPGDVVLDPHCGCATTPVAAERLGRQWIGMDLWTGTYQLVLDRLNAEKQIWRPEDVNLVTVPPERDDDADTAAPFLHQIERRRERRPMFSRDEMKAILIGQWTAICWGCGFEPPNADDRFFDLDHNLPKSQGGHNDLDNRAILCRPCNGRKSDTMTIEGLRRANRRDGYWYGSPTIDQRIPIRLAVEWAAQYLERARQQSGSAGNAD